METYGFMTATEVNRRPVLGGTAVAAVDPSPSCGNVADAMMQTARLIDSIENEIGALAQRLDVVMRPSGPDSAANLGSAVAQAPPSQLACGIRELNDRLYRAIVRVQDLTARVDL